VADDARIECRDPRYGSPAQIGAAAAEFEELGFTAFGFPTTVGR
jgi:hypothetical protein